MPTPSEQATVEQRFIDLSHGLSSHREWVDSTRSDTRTVVLRDVLRVVMILINPQVPTRLIDEAIDVLTADRSRKKLYEANKEIHTLIKYGYPVAEKDADGTEHSYHIQYINRGDISANRYQYAQQMHISGLIYEKRPDIIYFVNGIPLVVVECKNSNQALQKAYTDNITDYLDAIPQLFVYNHLVILTNGVRTKVGAYSSSYEHYYGWSKIRSEDEDPDHTMHTVIKGILEPQRLLDMMEHFVLYDDHHSAKIVAKNHQYLGVNNVYDRFIRRGEIDGKLGVYRHTQGSGKSYSMMFVVQKITRKAIGNFTFVIVTDRKELDGQIAQGFANCGLVDDANARADSIEDLKDMLAQDKKIIFTLIHKFDATVTPNDREDIIVMTDEAHRSQYGELAMYMRQALPRANFLGFTGTPLIQEEAEPTKRVFGEYVSVYNFAQSIEDGATVPIYYENYTPKVVNTNPQLQEDLQKLQDQFSLHSDDEDVIDTQLNVSLAILQRDDVLTEIANHITEHFLHRGKGHDGKALVVCINKKTAVRMYWKVQDAFRKRGTAGPQMGVMISLGDKQHEDRIMAQTGGDFSQLRTQIQQKDGNNTPLMEKQFKDPTHALQMVFVCNMWLTGFDAKNCTTLYLQKPMKGHTLMQTIARTNRVYPGKTHGLIVDYVNVFTNIQKALNIYASPELGDPSDIIQHQSVLDDTIDKQYRKLKTYLEDKKLSIEKLMSEDEHIGDSLDTVVENILVNEESYKEFFRLAKKVESSYQALLPNTLATKRTKHIHMIRYIRASVQEALGNDTDITSKEAIKKELENVLDKSIHVEQYTIQQNFRVKDLSKIDYKKLREQFQKTKRHSLIHQLATMTEKTIKELIQINPTRKTLMEKLEHIMHQFNNGSKGIDYIFDELVSLSQRINQETHRAAKQEMSEEQLAIYDLLHKNDLSQKDEQAIKRIAKELLDIVHNVIDHTVRPWDKASTRAQIKVEIESLLYAELPTPAYDDTMLEKKTGEIYKYLYNQTAQ